MVFAIRTDLSISLGDQLSQVARAAIAVDRMMHERFKRSQRVRILHAGDPNRMIACDLLHLTQGQWHQDWMNGSEVIHVVAMTSASMVKTIADTVEGMGWARRVPMSAMSHPQHDADVSALVLGPAPSSLIDPLVEGLDVVK